MGDNGPTKALIVALAFPATYAVYDFVKNNNKNFISILGFVSLLFSGGFGLMQLEGKWFALKEAGFPLIIGLVVLASAYTQKPLIGMLIYNDAVIDTEKVNEALELRGSTDLFDKHLKSSTIFFSLSFFLSAFLNYVLAVRIFTEISLDLPEIERQEILNQQIADMTWMGYVVILVPMLLITAAIIWYLFDGIRRHTGYGFMEVLREEHGGEN